jgi:polysaccharide export outer membrane protein
MTTMIRTCAAAIIVAAVAAAPDLWAQGLRPPTSPPPAAPASAPAQAPAAPAPAASVPPSTGPNASRGAAPSAAVASSTDPDQYRIGPEDTLEISVWKNQDLSRTVVVRPDGRISLPLLNDLQAAGLTPLQLRDVLIKGYSAYQPEPEVAVIVHEIHSIKISIVGGVKTPGRYELKSQATVLEGLALAGGFTDFAKRDQIVVLRRGPRTTLRIPFNYSRAANSEEENFFLQANDIIVVPN